MYWCNKATRPPVLSKPICSDISTTIATPLLWNTGKKSYNRHKDFLSLTNMCTAGWENYFELYIIIICFTNSKLCWTDLEQQSIKWLSLKALLFRYQHNHFNPPGLQTNSYWRVKGDEKMYLIIENVLSLLTNRACLSMW